MRTREFFFIIKNEIVLICMLYVRSFSVNLYCSSTV